MTFATVTSKGQITVPKEVRNRLRLQAGDRLEFVWVGDELRIRPARKKVSDVFGKYQREGQSVLSTAEMDEAIQVHVKENC